MRRWIAHCLLGAVLGLAFLPSGAQAQSREAQAALTAVDANNFPEMHAYVSVSDATGQHIPGLSATAFTLTENETSIAQLSVLESDLGVQVGFVLDANAAFKTRDAAGVNRLDYIKQALLEFAQTSPPDADDLTVIAPEGNVVAHVSAGPAFAEAVTRYTTSFGGAADPAALITTGLNFVSDTTPRPGMRRVLVILANGLPVGAPVADLVARAQAAQIPIHTVYVGSGDALETVGAQTLRKLSQQTGGLDLWLQNSRSLAPIFEALANQRPQYRLSYRSMLSTTGQHTLAAQVKLPDGGTLTTAATGFQLRVEPPLVTLPDLPPRIDLADTAPDYALTLSLTFPDGHPRQLREAQLLVDGQPQVTHTGPGVEAFTWPLGGYTESVTHTVQVRLTDELGLIAESQPVEVFVAALPAAAASTVATQQAAIVSTTSNLLIAGLLVVGLALIGGGAFWYWRLRPPARSTVGDRTVPGQPLQSDARLARLQPRDIGETIPLKTPLPTVTRRVQMPRLHLPRIQRSARAARPAVLGKAYLEVVEAGGAGGPHEAIQLLGQPVRLGRDPQVADVVFPDRSVSRLHARIEAMDDGTFLLFDEKSTSGTWVNFTQISAEAGHTLKPGDLINLGRVQLRFKLRDLTSPSANGLSAEGPSSSTTSAGEPQTPPDTDYSNRP